MYTRFGIETEKCSQQTNNPSEHTFMPMAQLLFTVFKLISNRFRDWIQHQNQQSKEVQNVHWLFDIMRNLMMLDGNEVNPTERPAACTTVFHICAFLSVNNKHLNELSMLPNIWSLSPQYMTNWRDWTKTNSNVALDENKLCVNYIHAAN